MKNIVLLTHGDDGQEARFRCAVSLARAIDGHLLCVEADVPARIVDDYFAGDGMLLAAEEKRRGARNRAWIEARLSDGAVPWSWIEADGAEGIARASRLADVMVVAARLEDFPRREMMHLAGEMIVRSGKPLLAVPDRAGALEPSEAAMVLWDGSGAAEAALRAAVPLLRKARRVHLVTVEHAAIAPPQAPAADYLARHGIAAVRQPLGTPGADAASTILEAIRAAPPALVVMGGFSHGRVIEASFGTVTRRLFEACPVPIFLAH